MSHPLVVPSNVSVHLPTLNCYEYLPLYSVSAERIVSAEFMSTAELFLFKKKFTRYPATYLIHTIYIYGSSTKYHCYEFLLPITIVLFSTKEYKNIKKNVMH
jgi:hypothetical protein